LATLIKQERLHNPNRTLLFNAGDQIQGDSMMYYFKSAPWVTPPMEHRSIRRCKRTR